MSVLMVSHHSPLPNDPIELARANWEQHGWAESADGMALVSPLGLTFARYEVLRLLAFSRRGAMPVGKIGERLQVHPASVTNAVQRLEADGLVRRVSNPNDGRGVLAEITDQGRQLVDKCTDLLNADVFSIVPVGTAEQRRAFTALRSIRKAFGDFE
jgi:DNA-binding MarR family transcriptional regulator